MIIFPRRVVFLTYNLYLKMLIFDRDINLNTVVKPAMHTSFAKKAKEVAISCKYCFRQRIRSCTFSHVIVYWFVKIHIILSIIMIYFNIPDTGALIFYIYKFDNFITSNTKSFKYLIVIFDF